MPVNVGTGPNSGDGDPLRNAFIKLNEAISGESLARENDMFRNTVSQGRPGELLDRYTSKLSGDRLGGKLNYSVVAGQRGSAVSIQGAGLIALRDRINLTDNQAHLIKAKYIRITNPTDPSGGNVRLRAQWLDNQYNPISQVNIVSETLTVAEGLRKIEVTIGRPGSGADHIAPSGATYAVIYVETFDADGVTHIEQLEVLAQVSAQQLYYPINFTFPTETIPELPETNIIHVAANGSDIHEGASRRGAVQSLERAVEIAGENPNDRFAISVHPGTYITQGNLDVPDNVTAVFGNHSARSTKILPDVGAEERSAFRMGNGGYVEGFSFEGGWRTDSLENPTVGVISFRPGAVIARTVYVHNVSFYRSGPPSLIPPPLDRANGNPLVGRGPCCIMADKSIVSQYSPFPQIMLWGATPVAPNNIGYCARSGAFINGINAVGLFSHRGFVAIDGGEMILTNCASQFGDWTLDADGSRERVLAFSTTAPLAVHSVAAAAINASKSALIDAMWAALVTAGFTGSEVLTRRDASFFLEAIAADLSSGQQETAQIFAEGMFGWNGQFVGNVLNKGYYVLSWQNLRDGINALGITSAAQAMVTALVNDVIIATVNSPAPNKITVPSQITSLFHQWNNAGTGVNGRALRKSPMAVPDTIRERNLGRVIWNGQDDKQQLYLSKGARVNGLSGQLEGPSIDRTILPRAARAAIIAGGQL